MIYEKVKAACKEKGIPVSRMESDLGFPRSSLVKWNRNEPGIGKVKKVADYLGKPIEYFLC